MTLREIAKFAGVSRSTVSRVINNQPGVGQQTRERVLRIIQEHDFKPDPVARSLSLQRLRKKS